MHALTGDALPWRTPARASFRSLASLFVRVDAVEPGRRRRGQILAFLSAALFLIGLVFFAVDTIGWVGSPAGHAAFNVATDAAFAALMATVWTLTRRGHVTQAAVLHLCVVSIGLVGLFFYTSPLRIEPIFVEPVFVAAFVLVPWTAFVWAGVAAASFAALNAINHGQHSLDAQVAAGLFGMAIVACLVASCLEWTVDELQRTAADLEADVAARRRAESEREQVRAALSSSEQRSRTLFETSAEGIFLFSHELVITDCNARFAAQAGRPAEALIGRHNRANTADSRLAAAMREALAGRVGHYEGPWRATTQAAELWVTFTASPQRAADGEVCGGIGVLGDLTGRKQAEELVERLAYFDGVTGLPNRSLFADRLRQAVASAERGEQRLVVGVLDLDRFKSVNDTLGSAAGDALLSGAAKRVGRLLRESDSLARSAADEFLLLLPQVASVRDAIAAGERILESLRQPWEVAGSRFYVSASIGFAVYPMDGLEGPELLENAHTAMRRAKQKGGNISSSSTASWARWSPSASCARASSTRRSSITSSSCTTSRRSTSATAPSSASKPWCAGSTQARAPAPGRVHRHGRRDRTHRAARGAGVAHRLRSGGRVAAALKLAAAGGRHSPPGSSTNRTSPRWLARVLVETGLDPQLLDVEITETSTIGDAAGTTRVLQQLRDMGVAVSLDDFGTGYSSLSHLPQLPITRLKIIAPL